MIYDGWAPVQMGVEQAGWETAGVYMSSDEEAALDEIATALEGAPSHMARLIAEYDWSSTPVGPAAGWPAELTTMVRHIIESHFPAAIVWGPQYTTIYNDAFRPILGDKPEALGRPFSEVWAEVWDEIGPIAESAYNGQATYIEDFELTIERFGRPEQCWFTFCYSPLRLGDGSVAGMIDTVVETTKTVRARADVAVVNNELAHRLKNTLALVQAIADQTLRSVSEKGAVEAFKARIGALSHAQDVLLRQNWSSASLDAVVRETLAPLDGLEQIEIAGPDLSVGSRAAVALSLILHELATNAAKYGALSVPDGRVSLKWSRDNDIFSIHWRELDGPAVHEPTERGFGTRLIGRGLSADGRVDCRYRPEGFQMDLSAPIGDLLGN